MNDTLENDCFISHLTHSKGSIFACPRVSYFGLILLLRSNYDYYASLNGMI